jgi:PhoH-like ATPase
MKKRFVLDTNVLLHDPYAVDHFADNEVIVPIYAIEEIDQFKRELSERGRNARLVTRYLDHLREAGGRLSDGVDTTHGGRLRVALTSRSLPHNRRPEANKMDDLILAVALDEQQQAPDMPVIFVTKDVNLRIRADAMGLQAVNYTEEKVEIEELYAGFVEITVSAEDVDGFYASGKLAAPRDLMPNEYVVIRDQGNANHSALARVDATMENLVPIRRLRDGVWGIRPRNKEQHFGLDLLLNDDVKLVTLVGKAGTGKTLLALAAGLQKVADENVYRKLLVSRPVFPLGKDIGFLPGDIEEKLNPWMKPIFDNIELLLEINPSGKKKVERGYEELLHLNILEIEPLTYIRGRSIPHQFMIIDEAQNLTPHEMKTILTRAGDNTKIVLTGDPYQIDNPYVDSSSNGLSYVVEKFKAEAISAHVTLSKGERSALAELAANLL